MRSAQGPETVARHGFGDCPALDLLLLPGGIGTLAQLANEPLHDFLRARSRSAEVTMSVCSGSAILAKAGLLDGRRATSNKIFFELARSQARGNPLVGLALAMRMLAAAKGKRRPAHTDLVAQLRDKLTAM